MKLKICGVRSQNMVQACQDELVDHIGFNFVPASKRRIDLELAQSLSHAFTGHKVGVFQDHAIAEIKETLSVVDLDVIQLHGQESAKFIDQLRPVIKPTCQVWKAVSVAEKFDISILQQYSKNCDLILFDGQKPGSGSKIVNTTLLHDAISETTNLGLQYGLAGGITPENISTFIDQFPNATVLDTASGVEENGEFSADKLRIMAKMVRDA